MGADEPTDEVPVSAEEAMAVLPPIRSDPLQRSSRLHRAVGLDLPVGDRADVERRAGVDHDRSVRWWRAMGFPEVPEGVPAFGDADVMMATRLAALIETGAVDDEGVMRIARLLGSSFSRIAEAQVDLLDVIMQRLAERENRPPEGGAAGLLEAVEGGYLELFEQSMVYVWRRHLLAALGRRLGADEDVADQAVGFADLTGFSKLSQRLSAEELGTLVDLFELTAFDVVAEHCGRVVKLIGDEVMFVAESIDAAVDIGIGLVMRLAAIEDMPPIHCGIAFGPTVSVGGDVFGQTVNLASRLTTVARAGTIVVPRHGADSLFERDDVHIRRVRRSYDLKGLGSTRIVVLRPALPEGSDEPGEESVAHDADAGSDRSPGS